MFRIIELDLMKIIKTEKSESVKIQKSNQLLF